MTRKMWMTVVAQAALTVACGDDATTPDEPDAGARPDASVQQTSDASNADGGASSVPDATLVADAGSDADLVDRDAGLPPPCGPSAVRCNGMCLSLGEQNDNCSLFAQLSAVDAGTTHITAMTSTPDGELYVSAPLVQGSDQPSLMKFAPTGGPAIPLSREPLHIVSMQLTDSRLYFSTYGESSTVHPNWMTGSVGYLPLSGSGALTLLARDQLSAAFAVDGSSIYINAFNIEPGFRRYDLEMQNETLLYPGAVGGYAIAGDNVYFTYDQQRIKRFPLSGATTATDFSTIRCVSIIGVDAQNLYAVCGSFQRFSLADGTNTTIAPFPSQLDGVALVGDYLYVTSGSFSDGPKFSRIALAGGQITDLAVFDPEQYVTTFAMADGRAYLAVEHAGLDDKRVPPFIVKIDL